MAFNEGNYEAALKIFSDLVRLERNRNLYLSRAETYRKVPFYYTQFQKQEFKLNF